MTRAASALAGRRLATAVAGLRKASELFKLSCTYDSCNQGGIVAENVGALAVYSESTLKAVLGKLVHACAFTVKALL